MLNYQRVKWIFIPKFHGKRLLTHPLLQDLQGTAVWHPPCAAEAKSSSPPVKIGDTEKMWI